MLFSMLTFAVSPKMYHHSQRYFVSAIFASQNQQFGDNMQKKGGIIACGHEKTAEAGKWMYEEGGNAFDACLAALMASFVSEPFMGGIGGGGFLNAFLANKQSYLFDFFCQTPRKKKLAGDLEFYPVGVDYGELQEEFHIGAASIAVPGMLAGIFDIHSKLCKLPMKVLAEPAIQLAKEGVKVDGFLPATFKLLAPINMATKEAKRIFAKDGDLYKDGDLFANPDLADFLDHIVREGTDNFYRGDLAMKMHEQISSLGSLEFEDFKNYKVEIREALKFHYKNKTVLCNPLPSIGGEMMKSILSKLQNKETYHWETPHFTQQWYEIQKASQIEKQALLERHFEGKKGSTTHISCLDEMGNAAGLTVSNGEGSGYVLSGTGVMLNNMLGESALLPNGFHSWKEDSRLSSMMSPTLVLDEMSEVELVCGTGGASRIPSVVSQLIHYCVDHQLPLEEAILKPRLHFEHNVLNLEPELSPPSRLNSEDEINQWETQGMMFGGIHSIRKSKRGIEAIGDPRRGGVVM